MSSFNVKQNLSTTDFRNRDYFNTSALASVPVSGLLSSEVQDGQVLTYESSVGLSGAWISRLPLPSGCILPYGGSTAPIDFLFCDGSAISRNTYANLFTVLGTTYGVGDGSTTFNLPNLQGRIPVGRDPLQTEFDTLGETGGSKTITLTVNEMPAHNHSGLTQSAGIHTHVITDPGHTHTVTDPGHTHGITDPGHNHTHTDPGHNHGVTDPGHFHSMGTEDVENGSGAIVANNDQGIPGPNPQVGETKTTGVTVNTNTTGILNNANTTGITNNTNTTGVTNQTNTTGVTNQNAGSHQHIIDSQGGSQPHNNLQPYIVLNYIIRI